MAQIKTWIVPGLTSGARRGWLTKYRMRFDTLQSDLLIRVAELESAAGLNGCASIEMKHGNSRLRATVYVDSDGLSVWIWRYRFSLRLGWLPEDDGSPSSPDDSEPDGTFELHPLAHGWELSQVDGCEPYVYPGPVHSKISSACKALEPASASLRPSGVRGCAKGSIAQPHAADAPDTLSLDEIIKRGITLVGATETGGTSAAASPIECSLNRIVSRCAKSIKRKKKYTRLISKPEAANINYCENIEATLMRSPRANAVNAIFGRALNATKRKSSTTICNAKRFLRNRCSHFNKPEPGAIDCTTSPILRRSEPPQACSSTTPGNVDEYFLLHLRDATDDSQDFSDAIIKLSELIYANRHYFTQHFPDRGAAMLRMSDSEVLKLIMAMPSLPARSASTVRSALRRLHDTSRKAAGIRPGDVLGVNFASSHQRPTLQ